MNQEEISKPSFLSKESKSKSMILSRTLSFSPNKAIDKVNEIKSKEFEICIQLKDKYKSLLDSHRLASIPKQWKENIQDLVLYHMCCHELDLLLTKESNEKISLSSDILQEFQCLLQAKSIRHLLYDASFNQMIYYPTSFLLSSASIIRLQHHDIIETNTNNEQFIQILSSSYKNTKRSKGESVKYKIMFIPMQSITSSVSLKTLELVDEVDYWNVIAHIQKTITFPLINSSYIVQKGYIASSNPSLPSINSSTTLTLELKKNLIIITSKLNVMLNLSEELFHIDINEIKALALSVDAPVVKPYLLHILPNEYNRYKIEAMDNKSSLLPSMSQYHKLCNPQSDYHFIYSLTEKDIHEGQTISGMLQENEDEESCDRLPFSISLFNKSKLYFNQSVGECVVPYHSLDLLDSIDLKDSSNANSILKEITLSVNIKQHGLRRGVRLVIHEATELPNCSSKSPSPYCIVYLIDKYNQKLSHKVLEHRTEVISNDCNPQWNKELILQGVEALDGLDSHGLEDVASVLVIVRDASQGILKHHAIAQVTIPINCFVYQTEARFCLPLESTNK